MHVEAIHSATHRAWLTTPYFVPGEPALMALTSAALRGVDVRLLLPRRSDSLIVSAAARSYFDELIAAGVKVWEYKARMLHSKTLVVDDHCAMAGTANFDNRSFRLNFEVMAVVYGPALAGPLAFVLYIGRFQIEPEERALLKRFGAEYAAYQGKVRRWL